MAREWTDLSSDERDLFENPHQVGSSNDFSTSGFGLKDRGLAMVTDLSESGKREALAALDKATDQLNKYGREYERTAVKAIRQALKDQLGMS